ncbi:MAG: DUF262 domain-containing protein [Magnetococcales bacterium]|nr:DUF262 domain-containing protein [Magnetococcales bacterium]
MSQDDPRQIPEIRPEIVFIFELVRDVEAGKIRIPNFQRSFVWRRDQMLDLLDSIHRQFPIGSLLVWETDTQLSSMEWVGPVHVPPAIQGMTAHVLDGQQRLSTLVGTMRKPKPEEIVREDDDPARWNINYNAKTNEFEHVRKGRPTEAYHLPMRSLIDTISFLAECQRMNRDGGDDAPTYVARAEALARSFQAYKMPVIRIRNTSLSKAVEIFARLNTKGQTITADQMVTALTYTENSTGRESFNLAKIIDSLIDLADRLHFGNISRTVILRACLAALGEDVYRTDWTRMLEKKRDELKNQFPSIIEEINKALTLSVSFFAEMGIKTDRLLPYAMQMVILMAFFLKCPQPSNEQKKFLRRWVWVSSFAGLLVSNPSRMEALIKEFRNSISQTNIPFILDSMNMREPARPLPTKFDMRSSRTRCFLYVLLSLHPRDLDGKEIPNLWIQLHTHGAKALEQIHTILVKDLGSSPANRMFRINMEEKCPAKDWLKNLQWTHPEEIRNDILRSHGIPPEAYDDLLNDRPEEFLRKRRDHLIKLEQEFMEKEGVAPPTNWEPQSAPIDTE